MKKFSDVIDTIFYYIILIPLALITITVVYKGLKYPDKIPDVLGYKLVIVFDDNMNKEVKCGDLLFIKIMELKDLEKKDLIAVRSKKEKLILKNVEGIKKKTNDEYEIIINDEELPSIQENRLEGKLIKRIPKIGAFLFFIQKPSTLISIALVIIVIGIIQYLIARKLDLKDMKKLEELEKKQCEEIEKEKITK